MEGSGRHPDGKEAKLQFVVINGGSLAGSCCSLWRAVLYFIRALFYFRLLHLLLGNAVAQLVEELRYKPEVRVFDSRWCHWNFLIDIILLAALWPWN
jgi:hypothetical protein